MNNMPTVSIIVPVYNSERYISDCINSILKQTFPDFELLLIDDGSQDNSLGICQEFGKKDSRIRIIHKENGGVSSARNLGLDEAIGDIIMFSDSDDTVSETWCESLTTPLFGNHECDLSISSFSVIDSDESHRDINVLSNITGLKERNALWEIKQSQMTATIWNKAFRKSIILDHNLHFNENISHCEDFVFLMQYICVMKGSFYLFDSVTYYYYYRSNSLTHSYVPNLWKYQKLSIESLNKALMCCDCGYVFESREYVDTLLAAFNRCFSNIMAKENHSSAKNKVIAIKEIIDYPEYRIIVKKNTTNRYNFIHKMALKSNSARLVSLYFFFRTLIKGN